MSSDPVSSDPVADSQGLGPPAKASRVFLSYSHDSEEHLERVLDLANRLRGDGVDAWLDQYETAPSEGWALWMERQVEAADVVLCVCTESYRRRFEGREAPGEGLGARWEGTLVRTRLFLGRSKARFLPVVFGDSDPQHVPSLLADFSRFNPTHSKGYEALLRVLVDEPRVTAPRLGARPTLAAQPRRSQFGASLVSSGAPVPQLDKAWPLHSTPHFRDAHSQRLGLELDQAMRQRDLLQASQRETTAVDARILDLKRDLRQGPQLQPGEFLAGDRYQLIKILGHGGFATVWLAQDRSTLEQVAIKVLHGQFSASEEHRERLFRGARQMAKLEHPHIVRVLDEPQVEEGWAFFAMEYLPGGDLRRAILEGQLDYATAWQVLESVAEALDHAHGQGIIHRDVKPGNILLDVDQTPKLADFDLVWADDTTGLTRTKAAMGSYLFAAPESMENAATVTARCDVYSLAATAVFVLQGKELSPRFLIGREAYLAGLRLPEPALEVLHRGLSLEPNGRPATARMLCRELRSALDTARRAPKPPKALADPQPTALPAATVPETPTPVPAEPPTRPRVRPSKEASRLRAKLRTIQTRDGVVPLWCKIPAGTGWIGSPEGDAGQNPQETPRHRIEVRRPFWLAAAPVTQAQYALFDPSATSLEHPNHPVVSVHWDCVLEFCRWLQDEAGLDGARLPTEEEWEYACRAGSTTAYWSGASEADLERVGWVRSSAGAELQAVGKKPANPWGLYDLHGNVWEWTASRWKNDYAGQAKGIAIDPASHLVASSAASWRDPRVIRGGSCVNPARFARSAYRRHWDPRFGFGALGFRALLPEVPSDLIGV